MAKQKMTRAEKSWIMYDVGNSALVLLATSVIPIYFSSLAPDGGVVVAWSYAETVPPSSSRCSCPSWAPSPT